MKLGYTIIYVPDVSLTIDFYERAFGLERGMVSPEHDYGELVTGDTKLAFASEELGASHGIVFAPNRPQQPAAAIEIAFVTDAVEHAYTRALDAGATSILAPEQKPWGQLVSYVRDLNGVVVELCSPIGDA